MKKFNFKKLLLTVVTLGAGAILLNKTAAGQSMKSKAVKTVKNFRK